MPADEELRKVAEDVRGLARALRSELRAARWEARNAARQARAEYRDYRRTGAWPHTWDHHAWWSGDGWYGMPPTAPPETPEGGGSAPGAEGSQPGWPGSPADVPGPADGSTAAGATAAGPTGAGPGPRPYQGPRPWPGHPGWPWGPYHPPRPTPMGATATAPPPVRAPGPARPSRPARPEAPARPAPPPVRHRRDGSTLISLLLVLVGLAWLGSASGVIGLSLETVLAAVLVVLGAGMVLTARTDWSLSRKHWPVWLGLIVLVLVMAASSSGGIAGSFNSMHVGPTSATVTGWSDAGTTISNLAGPLKVDLSNLPTGPGNRVLRVRDVFGPIRITLPAKPGYHIHVRAHTSFGPVSVSGLPERSGGMFTTRTADVNPEGTPVLDIDVSDAFGPVTVQQAVG